MYIRKQLKRLYAFGFISCLRLPDAVWVVLLTARGFSLWQIGLAEGIFHLVSLFFEIPSGVIADLIGRRRSLALAGTCGAVSALLMAFSGNFVGVCLSMVFSALACNFISGSDEALLYDSLVQVNRTEDYLAANTRYTQAQNVGGMVSHAGSLLTSVCGYATFYLLDAGVCLLRALTAMGLTEPTVTTAQSERQRYPFRAIGQRFRKQMRESVSFFRAYPRAGWLMMADGLIGLPGYLTLMFLQQRLNEQNVSVTWLGLPIMAISLARIVGVSAGKRLRPRRLGSFYGMAALLVGFGTVLAGVSDVLPSVLGAMVAAACMDAWMLHLQERLNTLFPSDCRATLGSVNNMTYSLLMIAASPLVGWLGDVGPTAGTGLLALGLLIAVVGVAALVVSRKYS